MAEHEGWSYLDSDNLEEFSERISEDGSTYTNDDGGSSFYGDDGSWGYTNADGSGSFYGADGSWGYRNADGSGSYYGEDGSWGYRNADGSGSFYGDGAEWGHWDGDGNKTYYGDLDDVSNDIDDGKPVLDESSIASVAAAAIGGALFLAAARRNSRKRREAEPKRAQTEGNGERQEKAKKPKAWMKSPAGRKVRKAGLISLAILTVVFLAALLVSSLRVVGRSSSELIGSRYDIVADHLHQAGFWDVEQTEIPDLAPSQSDEDGLVTQVKIGPIEDFSADLRMPCFIKPEITYHTLALLNPPISSEDANGMNYREVVSMFKGTGYLDVVVEPKRDVIFGLLNKEGEVCEVRIGDTGTFTLDDKFRPDLTVTIVYHSKVFG